MYVYTFKVCIKNDAKGKRTRSSYSYAELDSYRDYLRKKCSKISTVSKFSIVAEKPGFERPKRCNVMKPSNCTKETLFRCLNQDCGKVACRFHSTTICYDCRQGSEM